MRAGGGIAFKSMADLAGLTLLFMQEPCLVCGAMILAFPISLDYH